jgi:glycosyltransferase involved in cell wall biosynthesis
MSSDRPRVSVAVPVFNGEKYVAEAVESILTQTYRDLEVILCDNGSTDRTEEICREYAGRDSRVRYCRNEVNRGIHRNFSRGAELARGEYFMWLAHDDKLAPEFLERCVAALDCLPGIVLVYPKAIDIDDAGNAIVYKEQSLRVSSSHAPERFRELIRMEHNCEALFGLIRHKVLKRTGMMGNYADADRVLLAELALHGGYHKVPEFLFLHREHLQRATNVYPTRFERTALLTPEKPGGIVFPHFRQLWEYLLCIQRAPLSWPDRVRCAWEMICWTGRYRKRLIGDVKVVVNRILRRMMRVLMSPRVSAATNGNKA